MDLKINEQIILYCRRKGVSYTDLGKLLNITPQAVSQTLKKGNLREEDARKYAAALGLDLVVELREKEQ